MGPIDQSAAPQAVTLDPEIARIVDAMGEAPQLDLDALPLDEALRMVRQWPGVPPPPNSEDRQVDVGSGRQVRVRLYFPEQDRRSLPVLMHLAPEHRESVAALEESSRRLRAAFAMTSG